MLAPEVEKHMWERYQQLFCPFSGCKGTFPAPWSLYEVGIDADGRTVYRCPECKKEFTVDDMSTNAVKVAPLENSVFLWYHPITKKRLFSVPSKNIFTDGVDYYVHVPVLILNSSPQPRMFSAPADADPDEVDREVAQLISHKDTIVPENVTGKPSSAASKGEILFSSVRKPTRNL